jgi:hypothetical protein
LRRTYVVVSTSWLLLIGGGASANGLSSGLDGYEEPHTWESESLSFGVSAGWLTGQSHEFVYDGDGNKVSEWNTPTHCMQTSAFASRPP